MRSPQALPIAAVTVLVSVAAPAHASCTEDSGPGGSPVVFLGTAVEERRGTTQFAVDEVWAGPDLAEHVWVQSGQSQPPWPLSLVNGGATSSTDAEFRTGERYAVGASRGFDTGLCVVTDSASAADLRPDEPRPPVPDGLSGIDPPAGPLQLAATSLGGLAVLAAALVLWRRRRATV